MYKKNVYVNLNETNVIAIYLTKLRGTFLRKWISTHSNGGLLRLLLRIKVAIRVDFYKIREDLTIRIL